MLARRRPALFLLAGTVNRVNGRFRQQVKKVMQNLRIPFDQKFFLSFPASDNFYPFLAPPALRTDRRKELTLFILREREGTLVAIYADSGYAASPLDISSSIGDGKSLTALSINEGCVVRFRVRSSASLASPERARVPLIGRRNLNWPHLRSRILSQTSGRGIERERRREENLSNP